MFTLIAAMMVAQVDAVTPPAKEDDPIICERRTTTVGTHMKPRRKCMRKSDWNYVEKQTQREMQSLRDLHLSPGRAEANRGPE